METTKLSAVRRNRRTADQWHELLDRFDRSGQTQEHFYASHDLGLSTLQAQVIGVKSKKYIVFGRSGSLDYCKAKRLQSKLVLRLYARRSAVSCGHIQRLGWKFKVVYQPLSVKYDMKAAGWTV